MTSKEKIKELLVNNPNKWFSTRELRQMFGEASDRRLRELRKEGFKVISRRREIEGKKFNTFFWCHPLTEN